MLGTISNSVLWPRTLLVDGDLGGKAVAHAVEEAVLTTLARYGKQ